MQSVPINSKVVSSNPAHGEVYSIQHYVINVVSDLRQVVLQLLPQNKTKRHDITEILLKAGLNTKTRTPNVRTDCAKNLATEPEKRFNNYENTICWILADVTIWKQNRYSASSRLFKFPKCHKNRNWLNNSSQKLLSCDIRHGLWNCIFRTSYVSSSPRSWDNFFNCLPEENETNKTHVMTLCMY